MIDIVPYVSIIIVNYNGKHFLDDCLSSVYRQNGVPFEVIMVDNASVDGSAEFVQERYPQTRVIRSGQNLGFAGGNNLGAAHAQCEFIVLLNNDTIVHDGWLFGLVDAMKDPNVACASSLIKTIGIPERYYEKNGSINILGYNVMRIFDEPTDIFYAGGASMIYRKSIFGPPFDGDYFVYGEDVYLGLRTRFMGFDIRHTNASRLDHIGNGTAKTQKSAFLTFYQERNRILNILLFFSAGTILKSIPYIAANLFGKLFLSVLPTKYSLAGILRAHGWFIGNWGIVMEKRRKLRSEQRVNESAVIAMMTGKLTNGESTIGRIINALSLFYSRLVALPVRENLR